VSSDVFGRPGCRSRLRSLVVIVLVLCFQPDAPRQQRKPREQLSRRVYSGSISGSVFMLSIIQPVAPSRAALTGALRETSAGGGREESNKEQWQEKKSREKCGALEISCF